MMNEIKNQHVHLFWSLYATLLLRNIGFEFVFLGLIMGIIVEAYQIIIKKEDWKIGDRLLDVSFWWLGSILAIYTVK